MDAQVLMEQGELEQARQAFLVLEGYQDSEELAENIRLYLIAVGHPKSLGALKQYEYFIELGDFQILAAERLNAYRELLKRA